MENLQSVPLQSLLPSQGVSKSTEKHTLNKEKQSLSFLKDGGIRLEDVREEITQLTGPAPFDPLVALHASKIDLTKELKPPEAALVIRNSNGEATTVATLGNFQVVLGKAKSKKTFYTTLVVGAILNEFSVGKLEGVLPDHKKVVLVFDTEQSPYHVQRTASRILHHAGVNGDQLLYVYALRKYTYMERVQIIEVALQTHANVGFVVVDGLRDLIADINDPTESVIIVGKLMKWTEEYNIHIMCILHQNKGDENARGHLGTEAVNKAETVLSVSRHPKIKEISIVKAEYCRDKDPDEFAFTVNEEGFAVPIGDDDFTAIPQPESTSGSPIKEPWAMDEMTHREILVEVFQGLDKPRIKQLYESAANVLGERKLKASKNDIEKLFTWYIKQGRISQEGKAGTKASYYKLP